MSDTDREHAVLALAHARKYRHHPTCQCRRHNGYCSPRDELWSRALDRCIEAIAEGDEK